MIMIRCSFDIGGNVVDTFDAYRFIYVESDDRLHPAVVANEETSYADETGCHSTRKYIPTGFEYKIRFLVLARNIVGDRVNTWIRKFLNDIHDGDELKDIVFYNEYKRIKVKGQLKGIEYSDFYRDRGADDNVQVELTMIVREASYFVHNYFIAKESAFSKGYWDNILPWLNDTAWANNIN